MMPKSFLIAREEEEDEETEEKIMPSKSDTNLSQPQSKCDIFWRKNVFKVATEKGSSCNAWPNHWKSLVTRVFFAVRPKGGKFILSSGNRLQEYPVCPGTLPNPLEKLTRAKLQGIRLARFARSWEITLLFNVILEVFFQQIEMDY